MHSRTYMDCTPEIKSNVKFISVYQYINGYSRWKKYINPTYFHLVVFWLSCWYLSTNPVPHMTNCLETITLSMLNLIINIKLMYLIKHTTIRHIYMCVSKFHLKLLLLIGRSNIWALFYVWQIGISCTSHENDWSTLVVQMCVHNLPFTNGEIFDAFI